MSRIINNLDPMDRVRLALAFAILMGLIEGLLP